MPCMRSIFRSAGGRQDKARYVNEGRRGPPFSFAVVVARVLVLLSLVIPPATAAELPQTAGIASAHPLATRAGHEILEKGGNAFDAGVAVAAALAVVEPAGSGLGGGGFWLLHRESDGLAVMVDARERAPLAARADLYLDRDGAVIPRLSLDGPLAAGIPGVPAALAHIAARYGALPLSESLKPAIRLAQEGFAVSPHYQRLAAARVDVLAASPAAAKIFLHEGRAPPAGHVIRQPELAATLTRLAEKGREGFYRGPVAQRLVEGVRAAGGIWSARDLEAYRVLERKPLVGTYRGARITTAAPPSSGGVALIQMLNILSGYSLEATKDGRRVHLISEAMRLAYRDRARYLGDPDFVDVPVARLTSQAYAKKLRREIHHRAGAAGSPAHAAGGRHTTHFSIIDRQGNRVAATLSINGPFGAAFVPPGTGVLLNNEMDDFVAKPGVPNLYGLVGSDANAIAPGKRPLSSMTPTFVETDEQLLIVGTPGGSRIISMVLLATLDFVHRRGNLGDWVARPRFHHQYLPNVIEYEAGAFDEGARYRLQQWGHELKQVERGYGNMQAVLWSKRTGRVEAASDPRGEGLALVK